MLYLEEIFDKLHGLKIYKKVVLVVFGMLEFPDNPKNCIKQTSGFGTLQ